MKNIVILALLAGSGSATAGSFGFTTSVGSFGGFGIENTTFVREIGGTPVGTRLTTSLSISDAFDDGRPVTLDNLLRLVRGDNPEELALNLGAGLDVTYRLESDTPGLFFEVYAGPRVNYFIGSSSDSGGFRTIDTLQYGGGAGLAATYGLARFLNVVGDLGVNAYLPSGFGIASQNGNAFVAPGDPTYASVDRTVQQPTVQFRLKVGLQLAF